MTIPFLDLFKKLVARFRPEEEPPSAALRGVPADKPTSERLSKTVLPNTTRTVAPLDPFEMAAGIPVSSPKVPAHTPVSAPRSRNLPPVVALALEPKVERAISLQLSEILPQLPGEHVKPPESFDPGRTILLKASEIERGMASGKPTVSLATIYEQVPEIFLHTVPSAETMEVPLPLDKVMEQFASLQVRPDQELEQAVPQVETPILQVTLEDTARFGTTMEPLQTSEVAPVKVEPATAKTLSDAEPESAVRETASRPPTGRATIPLSVPIELPTPSAPEAEPSTPTRIPFHLPPNGTGEPVPERVPASSGPPVPTRSPSAPVSARPPIKVSPPCADLRPKFTLVPGVERGGEFPSPPPLTPEKQEDLKISLSLAQILQNLPAFQLNGSPSAVPDDVRIELPISLVQPQLATGRVAIEPKVFQEAVPKNFRELIVIDSAQTPLLLPLQEVLNNLPGAALQMRKDQEEAEKGEAFETPFSIKAKEDAQRFKISDAPIAKPAEAPPVAAQAPASDTDVAGEVTPEAEETMDAREAIAQASELPGVAACSLMFADGLTIAGNFPPEVTVEGLCAVAPSLLQRIENHMIDTDLGALAAMTLHGAKSQITFFMHGNICLTALHSEVEFTRETQSKLAEMAKKVSRTYSQPEVAHVDH